MAAREQHRVVSVNAKQSSWPLVERPWLCAAKDVVDATVFDPDEDIAAHATESIARLSACQPLATASVRVTSNGAAGTAPIQYP